MRATSLIYITLCCIFLSCSNRRALPTQYSNYLLEHLSLGIEVLDITPEIDSFFKEKGDSLKISEINIRFDPNFEVDSNAVITNFSRAYLIVTYSPINGHHNGYQTVYNLNKKFIIVDQLSTRHTYITNKYRRYMSEFYPCGEFVRNKFFDTTNQNPSMHPYYTKTDTCILYTLKKMKFIKVKGRASKKLKSDSDCKCNHS